MLRRYNQLCNSSQLLVQEMETNTEFYDLQRTRKCEDTSTESDSYIRGRLLLSCRNSMERSDTTCTTIREDQPRTVRWMSRKRLYIRHVPGRIEKRYFNNDENSIFKLWQWRCFMLQPNPYVNSEFIRKELWSTPEDSVSTCGYPRRSGIQIEIIVKNIWHIVPTL